MRANESGLTFLLNGTPASIDGSAANATLLDYIRAQGLTGAKEGCAEGECGACAVVMVAPGQDGSEYCAVNSCLVLLPMAASHEIYTVESLASNGTLAEVQRAMAASGASQCGYCTPGFVMSLFAEQYRPGRRGPCDPLAMAGNLCRCTGYRPIHDAALSLGQPEPGSFLERLNRPAPRLHPIATSTFARPATIAEACALLTRDSETTVVAGATDVAVEVNLRGRRPTALVSLEAIDELRAFHETPDAIAIGAGLSLTELGRAWATAPAAVHEWLELFASPLIRNRATIGGNLATASPIGDAAPVLAALDAVVRVAGSNGRREVPIRDFFTGYRTTALGRGDLVAAVVIPKPLPRHLRFYKVSKRRLDDISTVAAAMAIDLDERGCVRRSRFAFGGVAATPLLVREIEPLLEGRPWDIDAVRTAQSIIAGVLNPLTDHRGTREYRLAMAGSLVEKFWSETAS